MNFICQNKLDSFSSSIKLIKKEECYEEVIKDDPSLFLLIPDYLY